MLFHQNYLTGNTIKETLQYSQCSSKPVQIQGTINSAPLSALHSLGMVCSRVAALFSLSVRICTHLGSSELIFCSDF